MFLAAHRRALKPTRILYWLILACAAAGLTYVVFRSYLSPELLLHFSSAFAC